MFRITSRWFSNVQSEFVRPRVGDEVSVLKRITEEDVREFARLSGDTNPVHLGVGQERAIVHGALLNALVSGVIGTKLPGPGTLVINQTLNFPNKCFIDDEVKVSVQLVDVRKIITARFSCDVDRRIVLHGEAKLIMSK